MSFLYEESLEQTKQQRGRSEKREEKGQERKRRALINNVSK